MSAHDLPDHALAVIPCLNERDNVEAVIDQLLDDPDWVDPLIVVADGGSDDGTLEVAAARAASDPRVRVVRNARRNQAAALNLAVKLYGEGRDFVVRADAHADYPPCFVSRLAEEARRVEPVASVVVALHTEGRTCFERAVAAAQNTLLGTGGSAHRVRSKPGFVDHGHHALMAVDAFRAVGGYDETFTHNEDAELDVRLRARGGRIWLTREVEVGYFPRSTAAALFRQYLNYGRGRARTLLRHRGLPRLRQLAPAAIAPALLALALTPAWPLAALPAAVWAVVCCGYGAALAIAHACLCEVMAGPAAMIVHAGWSFGFWMQVLETGARALAGTLRWAALHER